MNINRTFAVILIVALLLGACGLASTPAPIVTPGMTPLPSSLGKISAEEKLVETGPSDNLEPVKDIADFFNNDTVRVTNGGVAKLDLFTDQINNQISIMIFNDTAVSNVKTDPSKTTDPFVTLLLVFGGLTGEVPKNGGVPVQFTTPNGVNIFILGTQFLVLYDPEADTTYIGNFDGAIAYSVPPGQSVQFTQAGQLYEISSGFEIKQSTMNFTRTDIENFTSGGRLRLLDALKVYSEPIATPTPTTTPTPAFTPTIPPIPTRFVPCHKAGFVADVTVPDGISFSPGFQFTKTWRLRNVGTCTWTTSYSLDFYRGDQMAGKTINLPSTVAPGQTVDVAVGLTAPTLPGSYRGDWMLRSSLGELFGVGARGTTPIWVSINVAGLPDLAVNLRDLTVACPTPPGTITPVPTGLATSTPLPTPTRSLCPITVHFSITNTSSVDVTSSFQILIEVGTPPLTSSKTLTVSGLAAGTSQDLSETLAGFPGSTVSVTVDSSGVIQESNENNNFTSTGR